MIAKLFHIERTTFFVFISENSERRINIPDFFVLVNFIFHRLLHVENFSTQRKYGLEAAISSLLCSSSGRISLDEIEFACSRIRIAAIGKFSGQPRSGKDILSLNKFSRFACGV